MKKLKLDDLNRVSVETFKSKEKVPVVLVMDNIRSALNIGSAFRTADAFALEGIVLCGISACPPHREILKTALGSTESVDWQYEADIESALNKLKQEDYTLIAIEQAENAVTLPEFSFEKNKKYAVIFGNEVDGVSEKAMELADTCIEIPQFGTKHSINVSVCIGIISWEFAKNWHF